MHVEAAADEAAVGLGGRARRRARASYGCPRHGASGPITHSASSASGSSCMARSISARQIRRADDHLGAASRPPCRRSPAPSDGSRSAPAARRACRRLRAPRTTRSRCAAPQPTASPTPTPALPQRVRQTIDARVQRAVGERRVAHDQRRFVGESVGVVRETDGLGSEGHSDGTPLLKISIEPNGRHNERPESKHRTPKTGHGQLESPSSDRAIVCSWISLVPPRAPSCGSRPPSPLRRGTRQSFKKISPVGERGLTPATQMGVESP